MTPSTDLEPVAPGELSQEQEAALAKRATQDYQEESLTLPLIALAQASSKVVKAGTREAGHYLNSLTGVDYGEAVELVVCYITKGRFFSDRKSGETYVAFGDVVPGNWPDKYAGQRFDELPDAEETYRERVNAEEIEWEKGPPIQTTRNFVGFVPEQPSVPVRLSLKSTSTPAARKIKAILDWSQNAPWHNTIALGRRQESNARDEEYFVVTAEQGRETTPEERANAINMFQEIERALGNLNLVGDTDEAGEAKAARRQEAAKGSEAALPVD